MSHPTASDIQPQERAAPKARVFWPAALFILVGDVATKFWAEAQLDPHTPVRVAGDVVRLTLGYNPGAAFGMYLGAYSRWIFFALAVVIVPVLVSMYRQARPGDRMRALALGLVCGGAVANAANRLWSERGVVDFLDVGIGSSRWPTFNVADIGITLGALLLAWILWREETPHPGSG